MNNITQNCKKLDPTQNQVSQRFTDFCLDPILPVSFLSSVDSISEVTTKTTLNSTTLSTQKSELTLVYPKSIFYSY